MESLAHPVERQLVDAAARLEVLLEAEALRELSLYPNAMDALESAVFVAKERGLFVITHAIAADVLSSRQSELKTLPVVVEQASKKVPAKDLDVKLRIFSDREVTEKSRCTGKLEDFVDHFRNRFDQMKVLLRSRPSEHPLMDSLSKVKSQGERSKVRLIAMVIDKRETKNGHLLIEVEDEKSSLLCLVSKNSPLQVTAKTVLLDEVIGFEGFLSKDLFIVENILWPDLPFREKKLGTQDGYIAFLSDLHIGSKYFLQEKFHKFLQFLNGNGSESERELSGKIKYLLIAGDLVDGVGVYPSQEKQLVTKDIYEQYAAFKEFMLSVPEHIHCIIAPGNHDAVRTAEPQPKLPSEFTQGLESYDNMHFVGNPSWFEVDGLRALMYHGTSMDSLISALNLKEGYSHPEKTAIELLKRRHLAPSYGDKTLVPEKVDYMVMHSEPDILHFGHVHKNGYAEYRGCFVVNSGTWQDTTDYQKRLGHIPTPCQLPLYHLSTGSLQVLNFKGA